MYTWPRKTKKKSKSLTTNIIFGALFFLSIFFLYFFIFLSLSVQFGHNVFMVKMTLHANFGKRFCEIYRLTHSSCEVYAMKLGSLFCMKFSSVSLDLPLLLYRHSMCVCEKYIKVVFFFL